MDEHEKRVKQAVIKARKTLQQKYRAVRTNRMEDEHNFRIKYKPILEPLTKISTTNTSLQPTTTVKTEVKNESTQYGNNNPMADSGSDMELEIRKPTIKRYGRKTEKSTSESDFDAEKLNERAELNRTQYSSPNFLPAHLLAARTSTPAGDDQVNVSSDTDANQTIMTMIQEKTLNESVIEDFLDQYDPLPRHYLEQFIKSGDKNEYDTTYGVRYNIESDKWRIGDSNIEIDGKDVILKGKRYAGTPGLYELLFKTAPVDYNDFDLQQYKEIISASNAHKKNFDPESRIAGNRGHKYKRIIKPLFKKSQNKCRTGEGLYKPIKHLNEGEIEYIYWNRPAELVARLRLLHASELAGNTSIGNRNEIQSIIEELLEEGIIY